MANNDDEREFRLTAAESHALRQVGMTVLCPYARF